MDAVKLALFRVVLPWLVARITSAPQPLGMSLAMFRHLRGMLPIILKRSWFRAATCAADDETNKNANSGIVVPLLPFGIKKYDDGERFDLRSPYSGAAHLLFSATGARPQVPRTLQLQRTDRTHSAISISGRQRCCALPGTLWRMMCSDWLPACLLARHTKLRR